MEDLLRQDRWQSLDPMVFVPPYVGVGVKNQTFEWLEK